MKRDKHLWLSIESNSTSHPLVQLSKQAPNSAAFGPHQIRFSPLFPISRGLPAGLTSERFFAGFFMHPDPAQAIAELAGNDREGMFYGPGLPSLVSLSSDDRKAKQLISRWKANLLGWEIWEVADSRLKKSRHQLKRLKSAPQDCFSLQIADLLGSDFWWIILELQHNLKRFAVLSAQYIPENLERCRIWRKSIQAIIKEIKSLAAAAPKRASSRVKVDAEMLASQKNLHSRTELLIHVNSALVYAISQAFHGAVPIRSMLPLMSQHSLLGIGTAWTSLRNLCSFVEGVFERFPVPKMITEEFSKLPWADRPAHSTAAFSYETELGNKVYASPVRPKITSFSSRLGFGEIDFTATCAAQTLHAAASSRHNLMTMSHELLHAHVKALVISIFADKKNGRPLTIPEAIAAGHQEWLDYRKGKLPKSRLRLIQTLRFSLVQFVGEYNVCLARANCVKNTGSLPPEDPKKPGGVYVSTSPDEFREAMRVSYRFLEEVCVHTLDFHYFYHAQEEVYIDAIWSSWSTVPSVLSRLEWYILRTLAPISTVISGQGDDVTYCFNQAVLILHARLKEMAQFPSQRAVAQAAIAMLDNQRIRSWLLLMFFPTLRLADLVRKYLLDTRIALTLWAGDSSIDWQGDKMRYLLEDFSFDNHTITNPVAFLVDRLTRALEARHLANDARESARSAWINLVLSNQSILKQ